MGPRADHVVPAGRLHPARPQGGPTAAPGRRGGRGGPGPAGGPRPALRPAAAVPRVQAGRRRARAAHVGGVPPAPPRGRPRGALRRSAARGADRPGARGVRRARGPRPAAQGGARAGPGPHPRPRRERAGAGHRRRRAAAQQRHADLPVAGRGRPRHDDAGGSLPRAAGAVPRGRGVLRPDDPARGAQHPVDRVGGRRGGDRRRVRRHSARVAGRGRQRAPDTEHTDTEHTATEHTDLDPAETSVDTSPEPSPEEHP